MNTFAYTLIIVGLLMITAAARGRRINEIGGDLKDLSVAIITADTETAREVLARTTASVDPTESFTPPPSGGATPAMQDALNRPEGVGGGGKSVQDLIALGKTLRQKGFQVSENKAMGDNPRPGVHMATGWHYKFDNSGALDVNWPNAAQEPKVMDQLAPVVRAQGFHVLWRVKGHHNHMHIDISRRDI